MQNLNFRPITAIDLPLVNRLMRAGKGYWGYEEAGLDRFMETFGISGEAYFEKAFGSIANALKKTIGYYLFKINEEALELDHFFLDTRFIGQGHGRYLWAHCVEAAQQKGWEEFTFTSDPNSRGFYEHMGAVQIDEKPSVILPGHRVPIMRVTVNSCIL